MSNSNILPTEYLQLKEALQSAINSQFPTHGLNRVLRLLQKEAQLYENHILNQEANVKVVVKSKVQLGGGPQALADFTNIDITPPADIVCDIREGLPLADQSIEMIFSEHCFEHLDYPKSIKYVIKECYRVLKPEGKLVIGVPDAEIAIRGYLENNQQLFKEYLQRWYPNRNCLEDFNTYIDLLNYIFRDQDDDPKYNPHYWAYDFTKLNNLLLNAGFSKTNKWKFDPKIANQKRQWGSVYIEAYK